MKETPRLLPRRLSGACADVSRAEVLDLSAACTAPSSSHPCVMQARMPPDRLAHVERPADPASSVQCPTDQPPCCGLCRAEETAQDTPNTRAALPHSGSCIQGAQQQEMQATKRGLPAEGACGWAPAAASHSGPPCPPATPWLAAPASAGSWLVAGRLDTSSCLRVSDQLDGHQVMGGRADCQMQQRSSHPQGPCSSSSREAGLAAAAVLC